MVAQTVADDVMTLDEFYTRIFERYDEQTALVDRRRRLKYAELDERSARFANVLTSIGLGNGDLVGLLLGNRAEYVVTQLGAARAGVVAVPFNYQIDHSTIKPILDEANIRTLVVGPPHLGTIEDLRNEGLEFNHIIGVSDQQKPPLGVHSYEEMLSRVGTELASPATEPGDVAAVHYTGGTTGQPKGTLHTHYGTILNMYAHIHELQIAPETEMLLSTPLGHSAGKFMLAGLLQGGTIHIQEGFKSTQTAEKIEEAGITWTYLVPTMIYRLLDHPDLESAETSSLESLVYGAAPMTPARLRDGLDEFGPVFLQFYGQTEVPNLITTFGKTEHRQAVETGRDERLSSAGYPCLMADVRVVDPETGNPADQLDVGEAGEILATAPSTLSEYYQRPDATAETVVDGWVRTGDVGKRDEDGYLYLLDRASDLIISGGMNVYSTEVEEVLDEHDGVQEVAVIGVPDDEWGEAVTAIVVPRTDDLSESDLLAFADTELADYKKPKSVEFRESIPKTPYGKMDKKALREPYWEDEGREIG